jgi:hypothetical protein
MSDYIPKSLGETYLRHQISRQKSFAKKMANSGKNVKHSLLSIPIEQAEYIVNKHKSNTDSIQTTISLLEELEALLDVGYEEYSPTRLRSVCKRALLSAKKIK